jgi:hypothetical protein
MLTSLTLQSLSSLCALLLVIQVGEILGDASAAVAGIAVRCSPLHPAEACVFRRIAVVEDQPLGRIPEQRGLVPGINRQLIGLRTPTAERITDTGSTTLTAYLIAAGRRTGWSAATRRPTWPGIRASA